MLIKQIDPVAEGIEGRRGQPNVFDVVRWTRNDGSDANQFGEGPFDPIHPPHYHRAVLWPGFLFPLLGQLEVVPAETESREGRAFRGRFKTQKFDIPCFRSPEIGDRKGDSSDVAKPRAESRVGLLRSVGSQRDHWSHAHRTPGRDIGGGRADGEPRTHGRDQDQRVQGSDAKKKSGHKSSCSDLAQPKGPVESLRYGNRSRSA